MVFVLPRHCVYTMAPSYDILLNCMRRDLPGSTVLDEVYLPCLCWQCPLISCHCMSSCYQQDVTSHLRHSSQTFASADRQVYRVSNMLDMGKQNSINFRKQDTHSVGNTDAMPPKIGGIGSGLARPSAPGASASSSATPTSTSAPKPKLKFKPTLQPKKVKAE